MFILWLLLLLGAAYWLFMSPYSQVFGPYPFKSNTTEKVVALTFDDGPNEPYTTELADYLKSKGIKATFFEVGQCINRSPETTKRLFNDGHVIANHTMSHLFRTNLTNLRFEDEITACQEIISKTIGKTPALYRGPWLWRQPWLLENLKKHGLQPVSGVFCYNLEVLRPTAELIADAAIKKTRPGAIIIFHDGIEGRGGDRKNTVEAVKLTVEALQRNGYSFVTVDRLLGVPAYQ